MPNISDTDLQMFRERAKSELASGCDVSRLRWDDIVESLCKEVARLRKELAASGNAAALREAVGYCRDMVADLIHHIGHDEDYLEREMKELVAKCNTALAAPPRNCDRFADELDAQLAFLNEVWLISVDRETMLERDKYENWTDEMRTRYGRWLFAPVTEKGDTDGR